MTSLRLALSFCLSFGVALGGCRDTKPDYFGSPPPVDTTTATGGKPGTGGRKGGTGGASGAQMDGAAVPPADATPATDGVVVAETGADVAADGLIADVVSSEVAPDLAVPVRDAAPADVVRTGPAACFPDPKVIAICLQLETACNNCPGGGAGTKPTMDCYAVVQKGDDAACAKYAVDKKCKVDTGGNVCGSLNCGTGSGPPVASGCNRTACRTAQGNGDSAKCQTLLAACPCK